MFCRRFCRISRIRLIPFQWCYSGSPAHGSTFAAYHQLLCYSNPESNPPLTSQHVLGSIENKYCSFHRQAKHQIHHSATATSTSTIEDQSDPFSLVADELLLVADRLRSMVVAEVPKLASAAEYFFKMGVEGKHFRPTVLLLMATALKMPASMSSTDSVPPVRVVDDMDKQLRRRHQCIAEITEMIHDYNA